MTATTRADVVPLRDPRWRPKLVVLDLDGTVVPWGTDWPGSPTPAVAAAVRRVLDAGVPVIVATGRAAWDAVPTAAGLGLEGIQLVCSNGAVIFDPEANVTRYEALVDVGPAARALSSRLPYAGFAVEVGVVGFRTSGAAGRLFVSNFLDSVDLETLVAEPTSRMVCRALAHSRGEMAEAANAVLPGLPYTWDLGYTAWLDVTAPGISKATGVARVAAELGVLAEDVLAIGDGSNDLPLFEWAGCSVAMGQASIEVRRHATRVTDPVENDGVATALNWWFFGI